VGVEAQRASLKAILFADLAQYSLRVSEHEASEEVVQEQAELDARSREGLAAGALHLVDLFARRLYQLLGELRDGRIAVAARRPRVERRVIT